MNGRAEGCGTYFHGVDIDIIPLLHIILRHGLGNSAAYLLQNPKIKTILKKKNSRESSYAHLGGVFFTALGVISSAICGNGSRYGDRQSFGITRKKKVGQWRMKFEDRRF